MHKINFAVGKKRSTIEKYDFAFEALYEYWFSSRYNSFKIICDVSLNVLHAQYDIFIIETTYGIL